MFSSLSKKELRLVSGVAELLDVPAGTDIVQQGESANDFFLILSGSVTVRRDGRVVAALSAGDYFGEMALLDEGPRTATVTSEDHCQLLVIGRREFASLLDEVPAIGQKLLVHLAGRLRDADREVISR